MRQPGLLIRGHPDPGPLPWLAQCPVCGTWSPVTWNATLRPGGWWWAARTGGCPACGALVLVESECVFRGMVKEPASLTVPLVGANGQGRREEETG
jgi:endogenous inhibitor of DNA gyrase (YacG/DUF329 family)